MIQWSNFLGSLTQAIRNFAKSLEGWLKSAMQGIPEEMQKTKVRESDYKYCISCHMKKVWCLIAFQNTHIKETSIQEVSDPLIHV